METINKSAISFPKKMQFLEYAIIRFKIYKNSTLIIHLYFFIFKLKILSNENFIFYEISL